MPKYPERLLTADESVIVEFRPHWRVLIPAGFWLVLALGTTIFVAFGVTDAPSWLLPVVGLISLVFVLGLAVPPFIRWMFTQYVLTTERIVVRQGVVARSGTEIPLESINNVLFSQSVVERMLGYGDIVLESAGESGQSRLRDVPRPEDFQSQVYAAREDRALHFSRGSGGGASAARDATAQLEALADLHERGRLTDEEYEAQKRRIIDGA